MPELHDRKHPFRLTDETYAEWRTPIFLTLPFEPSAPSSSEFGRLFEATLENCAQRWGLELHVYCLMPDHCHLVCSVTSENSDFPKFVRRFKREFCRQVHAAGIREFAWQRSFWDRNARGERDTRARIEYTLDNPVRRGLCRRREEWPWAKFYAWRG